MAINWAQVTQKRRQQTQVYVSEIYSIFVSIFLPFNNYIEFLIQSLQIIRIMQISITKTRGN